MGKVIHLRKGRYKRWNVGGGMENGRILPDEEIGHFWRSIFGWFLLAGNVR
jgi:hypothetical protein